MKVSREIMLRVEKLREELNDQHTTVWVTDPDTESYRYGIGYPCPDATMSNTQLTNLAKNAVIMRAMFHYLRPYNVTLIEARKGKIYFGYAGRRPVVPGVDAIGRYGPSDIDALEDKMRRGHCPYYDIHPTDPVLDHTPFIDAVEEGVKGALERERKLKIKRERERERRKRIKKERAEAEQQAAENERLRKMELAETLKQWPATSTQTPDWRGRSWRYKSLGSRFTEIPDDTVVEGIITVEQLVGWRNRDTVLLMPLSAFTQDEGHNSWYAMYSHPKDQMVHAMRRFVVDPGQKYAVVKFRSQNGAYIRSPNPNFERMYISNVATHSLLSGGIITAEDYTKYRAVVKDFSPVEYVPLQIAIDVPIPPAPVVPPKTKQQTLLDF